MYLNIACSVSGCTNPVIGQCPGYEGNCGRYYCATHSVEGLCIDCARRKLVDEIAQRTYEDYLQTAKHLRRETLLRAFAIFASIYFSIFYFGFYVVTPRVNETVGILLTYLSVLLFTIPSTLVVSKQEKARLKEISETKPGFSEFYKALKKKKIREAFMIALLVAEMTVAIHEKQK